MDVEGWQVLGGVTVIIVIYVLISKLFGAGSSSALAVVVAAVFGTLGLLLGRKIADRMQDETP